MDVEHEICEKSNKKLRTQLLNRWETVYYINQSYIV